MDRVARRAGLLLRWYRRNARDLPWRRSRDPYGIWVSEVMLQQTQVATVIPYWERWMRDLPDVRALASAGEERVLKLWEGLGYYRRARHLQAAAKVLVATQDATVPGTVAGLMALPGVGRYTAGAVASIAFGQAAPILDGNVIRVLTRLQAMGEDPRGGPVREALWQLAQAWVEAAPRVAGGNACGDLNQALMELGATVCTPRAPACERCPLRADCAAHAAGSPESFPRLAPRARATPRWFLVVIPVRGQEVGVRRRAEGAVNGGLWEFPNLEVDGREADAVEGVRRLFGRSVSAESLIPLGEVRHAITRYRVTQRAFGLPWKGRVAGGMGLEWRGVSGLEELAFSSAHRRLADRVRGVLLGGAGRRRGLRGG